MAVVPRLIGITEVTRAVKRPQEPPRSEPWNEAAFLQKLQGSDHPGDVDRVRRVLSWAARRGLSVRGGKGARYGTLYLRLQARDATLEPFYLYEGYRAASVSIYMQQVASALKQESERAELGQRLSALGFDVSTDAQYPGISLPPLDDEARWTALTEALDWIVERLGVDGRAAGKQEHRPSSDLVLPPLQATGSGRPIDARGPGDSALTPRTSR
jgi:hypothetical protein